MKQQLAKKTVRRRADSESEWIIPCMSDAEHVLDIECRRLSEHVRSLGRLPLPVNPIPGLGSEGGLCGMLFERKGERLPHPCAFTADPFPPQGWPRCEEECALRKVVPFSPRVPDEDFYDSDGYPDDRPDFSQTCEFTGSQLWPQPTFVMDQARDTESQGLYDQQPTEPVVYPTLYCSAVTAAWTLL